MAISQYREPIQLNWVRRRTWEPVGTGSTLPGATFLFIFSSGLPTVKLPQEILHHATTDCRPPHNMPTPPPRKDLSTRAGVPKPPPLRYLFPTLVTLPFHYPSLSGSRARFTLAAWCCTRLSSSLPASMHEAPEVAPPYLQASAAGGPLATHPGCLNLRDHCTGQWGPGPWRGLTEKRGGPRPCCLAHRVSSVVCACLSEWGCCQVVHVHLLPLPSLTSSGSSSSSSSPSPSTLT